MKPVASSEKSHEYSLKDGEVLKLIPAPFPDKRDDIYTKFDVARGIEPPPPAEKRLLRVTVKNGVPVRAHAFSDRKVPGSTPGQPLQRYLEYGLQPNVWHLWNLSDPNWLSETTVLDADVVVKQGAEPAELMAALMKELKAKCDVDLVLEYRDAETEVVVVSGKHNLNRVLARDFEDEDKASVIDFYATDKRRNGRSLVASTLSFPVELAKFVGRPVIDESDLKKEALILTLNFHEQYPATDATRSADRDPEKVLKNLEEQTGLTFKLEKRKVKALVVERSKEKDEPKKAEGKKPDEPKKDEPAWKAEFRKAYGLKDGELVRRVAPPFPECRAEYFRDSFERLRKRLPTEAELNGEVNTFTQFNWKDGIASTGWQTRCAPDDGVTLQFLLSTVAGHTRTRIESDEPFLQQKVTGDFITRTGADPEKLTAQLNEILRKELELPVKLSFQDIEEEVFVLSGKYEAKPLEDRKANEIEVYAVRLIDRKIGGGGSGTFREMTDAVERHVNRPIVLEMIDGQPKRVVWHFNFARPPTPQIEAQERDAETLLANIAAQTGLTVKTEKRKVRKLVVEQSELKK